MHGVDVPMLGSTVGARTSTSIEIHVGVETKKFPVKTPITMEYLVPNTPRGCKKAKIHGLCKLS
jgi:hypothetical protein